MRPKEAFENIYKSSFLKKFETYSWKSYQLACKMKTLLEYKNFYNFMKINTINKNKLRYVIS